MFDRRKANKSSSNGKVIETTTKKTNRDKNQQPATYELACDVTGVVDTNDTSTREDDSDLLATYANAELFSRYSTVSPVQEPREDYKSQVDKKLTARTAQHGADKTVPVDGSKAGGNVGSGSGAVMEDNEIVCDSVNDMTLVDNPIYASVTMPASAPPPPSAAADEVIFTSINDFTLIDNAIYNH